MYTSVAWTLEGAMHIHVCKGKKSCGCVELVAEMMASKESCQCVQLLA